MDIGPKGRSETRMAGAARTSGISRLESRKKRRAGRQRKVHRAMWADPYPWVMGTFPEKLVFAWLADRHIPFTFQANLPDYELTLSVENFRPDFLVEWAKVIIEVQGEYWHSLPEQAEHDVEKFAIYTLMGYSVYWFWEFDILEDLGRLMADVTEFRGYRPQGDFLWEERTDDLAGLRARNAASRRPPVLDLGQR